MSPKIANLIFLIALVTGAVISGIGSSGGPQWLTFLGLALLCGGLVTKARFFRCPHCGQYLGRSNGKFCQWCGKEI